MGKVAIPPQTILDMRQRLVDHGVDALGESTKFDLHHAIISKQDARGLSNGEYAKIHLPYNLLWVSHDIHASHNGIPNKKASWKRLCFIYGRDTMIEWFESINWNSGKPPFRWQSLED